MEAIAINKEKVDRWMTEMNNNSMNPGTVNAIMLLLDTCVEAAENGEKRKFVLVNKNGQEI